MNVRRLSIDVPDELFQRLDALVTWGNKNRKVCDFIMLMVDIMEKDKILFQHLMLTTPENYDKKLLADRLAIMEAEDSINSVRSTSNGDD